MKIVERATHFPEVFLHRALSVALARNGWQVREEFSYLTKRFDIVAFRAGILICIEVKTREFRKAITQLSTSRLIFHQVFVAVSKQYATQSVAEECEAAQCGLLAIGTPPTFTTRLLVRAPWCEERINQHTQQIMRIAGFKP